LGQGPRGRTSQSETVRKSVTASCGNGSLADDRRIVGRPWCARPCGKPHSGPCHVTLPPPARGQVRRLGLGECSVQARQTSRPRPLPRGASFFRAARCEVDVAFIEWPHRPATST
jgi:hypothetical protein